MISIHAPRVGSDRLGRRLLGLGFGISIHAPRVGSDRACRPEGSAPAYFNPRSPCGERPAASMTAFFTSAISIHAPRVGSDMPLPS